MELQDQLSVSDASTFTSQVLLSFSLMVQFEKHVVPFPPVFEIRSCYVTLVVIM